MSDTPSTPTLDEQIAAAEADLIAARDVTSRTHAGAKLDELNAAKLSQAMVAQTVRDGAQLAQQFDTWNGVDNSAAVIPSGREGIGGYTT